MPIRRGSRNRPLWFVLIITVFLAGFGAWEFFKVKADKPRYLFATVVEGDMVSTVVAQGTLAAVTTVDVGTQVSGTISELYADFNSQVKKVVGLEFDPSHSVSPPQVPIFGGARGGVFVRSR